MEHGKKCVPSSNTFSMILQTEILSKQVSDFLKQIIVLKSFNSVFFVYSKEVIDQYLSYGSLISLPVDLNPNFVFCRPISKFLSSVGLNS